MKRQVAGVDIPDSALACAALEYIRSIEPTFLFNHALRSYLFGALAGYRHALAFDEELLLISMLFHNVGLHARYQRSANRFEIDSANEARDFLRRRRVEERLIADVWTAIALHMTPGIPEHMSALVSLVTTGVQMDLRGMRYDEFTAQQRREVIETYPREAEFKFRIIEAYARGMEHRPDTTFGSVNADVLDRWDPNYRRLNFCGQVFGSPWSS